MPTRRKNNLISTFIVTIAFATLSWLILEAKLESLHQTPVNHFAGEASSDQVVRQSHVAPTPGHFDRRGDYLRRY